MALCVAVTSALPLQVVRVMPVASQPEVELICQVPWRVISAPLAYNALIVIVCSYYAFKTRHLPDNFNEARFITFCVRITLHSPPLAHTHTHVEGFFTARPHCSQCRALY